MTQYEVAILIVVYLGRSLHTFGAILLLYWCLRHPQRSSSGVQFVMAGLIGFIAVDLISPILWHFSDKWIPRGGITPILNRNMVIDILEKNFFATLRAIPLLFIMFGGWRLASERAKSSIPGQPE